MRWFRRITFHRSDATPKWHIVEGVEHRTLVAKCGYRYDNTLEDTYQRKTAPLKADRCKDCEAK